MKEQAKKNTQALEKALQMEIEGQEFYRKAEQGSDSSLAKELFRHLVEEENLHINKINEIYRAIKSRAEWPNEETVFKHEKSLKSVFKEAIENMDKNVKVSSSEIEAFKTAMDMEDKSYSFYNSRVEEAVSPAEKSFYQALTAEERGHYLTLLDSYEYLTDPQGWFVKQEHSILDGG
ncbi:ferritin family protein [Chloroflexota bacterium]